MTIETVFDRHAFAEAWASDELAEANDPSFRAPDGELFRIAYQRHDGIVVADSGRWLTPVEFNECERVTA